jgi:hypothetical protein
MTHPFICCSSRTEAAKGGPSRYASHASPRVARAVLPLIPHARLCVKHFHTETVFSPRFAGLLRKERANMRQYCYCRHNAERRAIGIFSKFKAEASAFMKRHQRTVNRSRLPSKELRVRNRGWDGRDASASVEPRRRLTIKRLTDDRYCSRPVTCGCHLFWLWQSSRSGTRTD